KSNVGILWDIHHPLRYFNEPYKETYTALKEYIKFIHVKDSIVEDDILKYKMTGSSDIPVMNILDLLKENRYEGYVSLEWVKRWHNDLEDPEVALTGFSNFMNMYKK
ncbi:MAG TPA: TIM barrel protein, partial [Clostridia bacterium]